MRFRWLFIWLLLLTATPFLHAFSADEARTFLTVYCVRCHNATKHAADIRFDDLPPEPAKALERWASIRDQVRDGLMPPKKEKQPPTKESSEFVLWIGETLARTAAKIPNQGNLVPHELLFEKPISSTTPPPPRVWRLSPEGYLGFVRDVSRGKPLVTQPFTVIPERGIKDFAALYTIDEPTTEILLRNAEAIVASQTAHEMKDGKLQGKNDTVKEFVVLMDPNLKPTIVQLEVAIQTQYRLAINRKATTDEVARYLALYERAVKSGDSPLAVRTMLQAILLKTDAVFRVERAQGQQLTPTELVQALSLALRDTRDPALVTAANKGELTTKDQITAHVRRMVNDQRSDSTRILRFFHEYFSYHHATDVFKDKPKTFVHEPRQLVLDTDRLIMHIVNEDRDVFRQLLTTPKSFVNYATQKNKKKNNIEEPKQAVVLNPNNNKGQQGLEWVYGIPAWTDQQPVSLPENTRLGVLMQPSWLVAWSTNFDNDPVRRGRWIRERLLGGTVPDLPIGVVAQVPDDPHRTFRDRLTVTRKAECWRCHQQMDELGLPFENFDHYGRFRTTEPVQDVEATAKNVDKKGKHIGPIYKDAALVTTGTIAHTSDEKLDGNVRDARELITKIANSDRARQVFIRHAFRYFMGRNESLADAKTLQDADNAYLRNGGSFKELVVSLLTSDSFLLRTQTQGDR